MLTIITLLIDHQVHPRRSGHQQRRRSCSCRYREDRVQANSSYVHVFGFFGKFCSCDNITTAESPLISVGCMRSTQLWMATSGGSRLMMAWQQCRRNTLQRLSYPSKCIYSSSALRCDINASSIAFSTLGTERT